MIQLKNRFSHKSPILSSLNDYLKLCTNVFSARNVSDALGTSLFTYIETPLKNQLEFYSTVKRMKSSFSKSSHSCKPVLVAKEHRDKSVLKLDTLYKRL